MPAAVRFAAWSIVGGLLLLNLLFTVPVLAETTWERIKREGVIKVGVANEVPYGFVTPDGKITGEAPEIIRQMLAENAPQVALEGVVTSFQTLIPELNAGRFDVIAAGMFITPDRCAKVVFSNPTYKVGETLIVKADNPKNLTDFSTIAQRADARLAVMAGAVEYGYAYEAGVFVDQVSLYPDYPEALAALKAGQLDAIAMTTLTARHLVEQDSAIEATPQFFPVIDDEPKAGYGAFAFRQADQELVAVFNQFLASFIGSDQHWKTVKPFGFLPDTQPDTIAQELCQE